MIQQTPAHMATGRMQSVHLSRGERNVIPSHFTHSLRKKRHPCTKGPARTLMAKVDHLWLQLQLWLLPIHVSMMMMHSTAMVISSPTTSIVRPAVQIKTTCLNLEEIPLDRESKRTVRTRRRSSRPRTTTSEGFHSNEKVRRQDAPPLRSPWYYHLIVSRSSTGACQGGAVHK